MWYPRTPLTAAVVVAFTLLAAGCTAEEPEPDAIDEAPLAPSPPEPDVPPPPPPPPPDPPEEDEPAPVPAYGVSAGHPAAVDAGMGVLAAGGNAVDAAIAAAYAISVVEPFASGIGGGGATVVAKLGDDPVAYDYREVVAEDGRIPASNTGIPGFVAGMEALHDEHGSADLTEVLEPAVTLARDGATTSGILADQLRSAGHRLPTGRMGPFFPGGTPLGSGDQLVQETLADTLERIAADGAATFYDGDLGAELAAAVDGIDAVSLAAYDVQQSEPAYGTFAGYRIVAAAPPLPGAALVQMLQIAEALDIGDHEPGSADFFHTIAMSWRLADQALQSDLGDPKFVDVPLNELTDPDHNATLADQVSMDTLVGLDLASFPDAIAGNTTHITTVDADGTVVSMTNTLTNFWGSGQYELGFFLNDQLSRFAVGRTAANEPAPGRRSVSWSLPAVVLDGEDRPVLGIGSPGGRRIPNILTQVLVRWAVHGQSLEEAVAAPRFHLEGSELELEQLPGGGVADDLRGRGYTQLTVPPLPYYFGSVQALEVDYEAEEVVGARDERREGDWRTDRP